jgi:hypothetical protein
LDIWHDHDTHFRRIVDTHRGKLLNDTLTLLYTREGRRWNAGKLEKTGREACFDCDGMVRRDRDIIRHEMDVMAWMGETVALYKAKMVFCAAAALAS